MAEEVPCEEKLPCSTNADVEDQTEEELKTLRGDAIGDTMYSERFVLKTILKLRELSGPISESEDLEGNLCSLWDMTTEEDVISFLLKQNAVDIFCECIKDCDDERLIEILLGIIGNMCLFRECLLMIREREDLVVGILECMSHCDPLTLIQLMRLLAVLFQCGCEENKDKLYGHFCKVQEQFMRGFTFVMLNSANVELLQIALSTFYSMVAALDEYREPVDAWTIFLQADVVQSLLECFRTLVNECEYDTEHRSKRKDIQIFANINWRLKEGGDKVMPAYESNIPLLLECVFIVLQSWLDDEVMQPYDEEASEILQGINEIMEAVEDPFEDRCLELMIRLSHNFAEKANDSEEFDDDEEKEALQDMCTLAQCMTVRMAMKASDEDLQKVICKTPKDAAERVVQDLLKAELGAMALECAKRIQKVLDDK